MEKCRVKAPTQNHIISEEAGILHTFYFPQITELSKSQNLDNGIR